MRKKEIQAQTLLAAGDDTFVLGSDEVTTFFVGVTGDNGCEVVNDGSMLRTFAQQFVVTRHNATTLVNDSDDK